MRINALTRVLHFLMIITVAFQLFSGLFMEVPEPGKIVGWTYIIFSWHIIFFGWLAFLVSGLYASIRFSEPGQWHRLIPWFTKKGRDAFMKSAKEELPGILSGKLALPEKQGALAGAMHGLGFTLLICMGMTGAYVMNGVRSDGSMTNAALSRPALLLRCADLVISLLPRLYGDLSPDSWASSHSRYFRAYQYPLEIIASTYSRFLRYPCHTHPNS